MRIPEIRRKWACSVLALLVAFGLAAAPALAQTDVTTSRISGTVEGSDGAPLPGVTVEATNTETGLVQVAVTDEEGFFRVLNLPTGTYKVVATLEGFATSTADNVRLLLGSTPTINFTLQSSSVAESITVTAESLPVVEVTNTQIGTTIQSEQIEAIPSAGRDFKQLVLLTPESRLDSERGNLALSGERGINTSITVDGVDYNNAFFGGAVGGAEGRAPLSISQESIKEFSVVTNGASVEYGRSGGGFVNIITKSGTNNLHGSLFYFNQPQSLISDFPRVGTTPGREANDQDKEQFGGSLGGAIIKDRLFYFLSYDNQDKSETVPILPSNLPANVFAKWPVLSSPDTYVQTQDGSVAFGRLDFQANPAHRFMVRANFIDYEGINGTSNAGTRTESYNGVEELDTKAYVGSYSGQFGANLLNDLNINFIDEETPRNDKGLNLPEIQVGGSRYGEVAFLPIQTTNERKAFADTVSYLLDRHVLKAGAEYNETSVDQIFRGNWRGVFIFSTNDDLVAGRWREYRQFGGLGGRTSEEGGTAAFEQKETAFFLQDQWFVSSNLTLTAGVRIETLDNPDAPILNPNAPGPGGTMLLTGGIPDSENQISPRLGLSWAPDEKTAVRFSVGRYWSRTPALLWAQPFTANGIQAAQLTIFACPGGTGCTPTSPAGPIGPSAGIAPGWGPAWNPVGVERVNFGQVGGASAPPDVFTVDPDFENPYTDRVTLGAEREILPLIALGLDITYAEGNQLQRLTDFNRVYCTSTSDPGCSAGVTASNGQPRYSSARKFAAYNRIVMDLSDAESEYKAATLTLQRRYSSNYSLYGAVTWSEDRDHDSNERNFAGIQMEDFNNIDNNWGPSNRDQEWKVVLNGVWDTPWWGIGLSGAFRFATGSPFTPTTNVDVNGDGNAGTDRPTVNGVHLGRNSERFPDFYTFDLRLAKKIALGPGDIAVFAECFNCTNQKNTGISTNNQIYGDPAAASPTNPIPRTTFTDEDQFVGIPRTFQLGLRYDF